MAASEDMRRAYRLRDDERVPDGIRRIARGQLAGAHEELAGASQDTLGEAVHKVRKRLKRLRACLRLARDALGEETYERENAAFRTGGRRLSGARDAHMLVETVDGLNERIAGELPLAATAPLLAALRAEHERATVALRDYHAAIDATLDELHQAGSRTPRWDFDADGFDALKPGLRRIYRRGRKRMRVAARDPTTENLHEARKRVKDLWHATQIVRPAAPKKLKKLSRRAHDVAKLIGDDHDLAVLREYVERHPGCFEDEASKRALLVVLDRRRDVLQHRALKLGRRLYKRSPKRFVTSIERGWRKRAIGRPKPLAG
jgi:CHAD domain-containing protein